MKPLLLALTLLATHAHAADFITKPGIYYPFEDTTVRVTEEDGKIQYRFEIDKGRDSAGPTYPSIDPKSDWFIYPETARTFWAYFGNGRIVLTEFKSNETKFTGSEVVKDLLDRAPAAVQERVRASTR